MLTIQPPFIRDYFIRSTTQLLSKGVFRRFYLSWEDALWHLLITQKVSHGSKILVPEFYCFDVVKNMKLHSLNVLTYEVDEKLRVNKVDFVTKLTKLKPKVVVVFHAVGIYNPLMDEVKSWTSLLKENVILIEDSVHKIIVPSEIKFVHRNHYVIDSLRKVVPLQGSCVYSQHLIPTITSSEYLLTLPYQLRVMWWWMVMQLNLCRAYYAKSLAQATPFNLAAETAMMKGYDLIGTSQLASPGSWMVESLIGRIDSSKIAESKTNQAMMYHDGLKELMRSKKIWTPKIAHKDWGQLRGYPLILRLDAADRLLAFLRDEGIMLRFELNDSPWSKRQKIIFLPMGLHLSASEIELVITKLAKWGQEMRL